jgi:tetratricopeptide (TPR) repeat protein
VRAWRTVQIFAQGDRLPFDVGLLRGLPYTLNSSGKPKKPAVDAKALTAKLKEAVKAVAKNPKGMMDSPIYQLVEDYPNVSHEKTDVFRDLVEYSKKIKNQLEKARKKGIKAIKKVEKDLGNLKTTEAGVLIDLFLSYRAVEGWREMIALFRKMPAPLSATVMAREQFAFALNRAGRGKEAEKVLLALIKERGSSSETQGLLGRVYKDRWESALSKGKKLEANALLDEAIDAYTKGFEADWRDAYPGINAVTLMELKEPPDPRREKLLPLVFYAVERHMARGTPDYWDYATLLELAVLNKDQQQAEHFAAKALAHVRESWEPKTTMRNLTLLYNTGQSRNEALDWIKDIVKALEEKRKQLRRESGSKRKSSK